MMRVDRTYDNGIRIIWWGTEERCECKIFTPPDMNQEEVINKFIEAIKDNIK